MYVVNVYNGVYQLEFRGFFDNFDDAMEEFQKAEKEYMNQFEYEVGTTDYNHELENFIFNSRIEKV
ncbi:MAG: hypothetical protein ACRCZR_05845 [Cetobacterium sp.]|uniref:hypothetical protein n=1 Tax=Cetobacterium sp. TaxID=2071632 RepID=UPI003EE77C66